MLPIPASLELYRDEAAEQELYNKFVSVLGANEREGIHASDLLDPRLAYWRKVKPLPPTQREVMFFLIGRVLHEIVLQHDTGEMDLGSIEHPDLGIIYSPDDKDTKGRPIELKTSRAKYEPKGWRDLDNYLEQLLIYMAAMGAKEGRIDILYLSMLDDPNNKFVQTSTPQLRSYGVKISKKDLEYFKSQVKSTAEELKLAIKLGKPEMLELCREWKCGARNCPYWKDCKPEGRYAKKAKKEWEK